MEHYLNRGWPEYDVLQPFTLRYVLSKYANGKTLLTYMEVYKPQLSGMNIIIVIHVALIDLEDVSYKTVCRAVCT